MKTACLWCDYLICDSNSFCDQGLMLHHYLKQKGFDLKNEISEEKYLDDSQKSEIFIKLTEEMLNMLESGEFKQDKTYLESLEKIKETARDSMIHSDEFITVLKSSEYLDPLATYQIHDSQVQILLNPEIQRYEIGVHPKHYDKGIDLTEVIPRINAAEAEERKAQGLNMAGTWGRRKTAFGSPRSGPGKISSVLPIEKIQEIIENHILKQNRKER